MRRSVMCLAGPRDKKRYILELPAHTAVGDVLNIDGDLYRLRNDMQTQAAMRDGSQVAFAVHAAYCVAQIIGEESNAPEPPPAAGRPKPGGAGRP